MDLGLTILHTRMALWARRGARAVTLVLVSDHGGLRRGLLPRNHQHHLLVVLRKWMVYSMNLCKYIAVSSYSIKSVKSPGRTVMNVGPTLNVRPLLSRK